jgi:hypothetical protein
MKSEEIKAGKEVLEKHPEMGIEGIKAAALLEIAYQLAVMNEREQKKLEVKAQQ